MGDAAESVSLEVHCKESWNMFVTNGLSSPDLPGLPTIVDDMDAVKGGDVQLVCEIEDPGNPEATSYVWKK